MTRKLRFAPIVRVSTEQQAEKGESLQTQQKQIISYVQTLGGVIQEACWKYSGQKHATPDQERKKLDQLLSDSAKGLFDAVIVCDAMGSKCIKPMMTLCDMRLKGIYRRSNLKVTCLFQI